MIRKQIVTAFACIVSFVLTATTASTDIGGRGRAITPYRDLDDHGASVALARVECEMRISGITRTVQNFEVKWPEDIFGGLDHAGLAFVDATRARNEKDNAYAVSVFHYLEGSDESGKPIRVEFSRLQSIEIMAVRDKTARLRVKVFPATTTAAVIAANKISYATLKKDVATVVLSIPTRNDKGEELVLVSLDGEFGQDCTEDATVGRVAPIPEQMKAVRFRAPSDSEGPHVRKHIRFVDLERATYEVADDNIWWAVPSVISDPDYPHRRRMKR